MGKKTNKKIHARENVRKTIRIKKMTKEKIMHVEGKVLLRSLFNI